MQETSRHGCDPWVGEVPWRRGWPPTPVFSPGESYGQRSLAGLHTVHRLQRVGRDWSNLAHAVMCVCAVILVPYSFIVFFCLRRCLSTCKGPRSQPVSTSVPAYLTFDWQLSSLYAPGTLHYAAETLPYRRVYIFLHSFLLCFLPLYHSFLFFLTSLSEREVLGFFFFLLILQKLKGRS